MAFFESKTGFDSRLVVVPTTGGEGRVLLLAKRIGYRLDRKAGPVWTSNGRYLIFGRGPFDDMELWRISSEGGEPQKLEVASRSIHGLTVHPDGRRIAFTGGSSRGTIDVWVMENFLPPLARAK